MLIRCLLSLILVFTFLSCSKKEKVEYEKSKKIDPYIVYQEALEAFEEKDYFFASKKFNEVEINSSNPVLSAKAAIMSSYALYGINFYKEAEENLIRYFDVYPVDKNIIYANYLLAIIYYEQIQDEKKDLQPLLKAKKQIDLFVKKYPNNEYSTDLKFKLDLIDNQLAAKELYIAKYYISVKKWVPAINRLRNILKKYDKTIFVEEALHRLVEINFHIGLEDEAKKYAAILGYNYNSSEWFRQSYKILNKDYKFKRKKILKEEESKKDKFFFKKIIEIIK